MDNSPLAEQIARLIDEAEVMASGRADMILDKLDQIDALTAAIRAELLQPVPERPPAPTPPSLPLLTQDALVYQGSARLPWLDGLQYPDGAMAVREPNRLTVQGRGVAFDVRLEAIGDARQQRVRDLPSADTRPIGSLDPADARLDRNPADTTIRGLFYPAPGEPPLMSVASFYDASSAQTTSHLWYERNGTPHTWGLMPVGHTAGFMSWAPAIFGDGKMLTGNFGLPIVTRQSFGPAAFLFDPDNIGAGCRPLLDYPGDHPLGPWNAGNPVWHSDSKLGGLHWIQDTRSLLFVGVHGLGRWCYGPPWDSPDCANVRRETDDHGSHSDPYVYRIWAYDVDDLAKVYRGEIKSWEPRPYGLWNLELPYPTTRTRLTSAYDPASQQLYLLQQFGAFDEAQGWPVLHMYQVRIP